MVKWCSFRFKIWIMIILMVACLLPGGWLLYKGKAIVRYKPVSAEEKVRMPPKNGTIVASDFMSNCQHPLGPTQSDDLAKIKSYKFDGISNYTKFLFPSQYKDDPKHSPDVPVIISAISSNHFLEFLLLLVNLEEVVRPKYKDWKFVLYDIGLLEYERKLLTSSGLVEVRDIPYDKLPSHVRHNKYYTWKPIVTLIAVMEHKYVFWVDASIRFKTGELDELFAAGKKYGLMGFDWGETDYGTIPQTTARAQFDYLGEDPCTFGKMGQKATGVVLTYANQFIYDNYLRPWIACALKYECMVTDEGASLSWDCDFTLNHACHRYEQSFHGMLYSRLFHSDLEAHEIDTEYFYVCRVHKVCLKN